MFVLHLGFRTGSDGEEPPAVRKTWIRSLGWEDPLEEGMATHPVFLPGESHGQRSLAGYSAQLDTTKAT